MFDKLKGLWAKYWAWIFALPDGACVLLVILTVSIPVSSLMLGISVIIDSNLRAECLDSQLARRWTRNGFICQEYHDGEWIKVNLSGDNIYYYNDAASRAH